MQLGRRSHHADINCKPEKSNCLNKISPKIVTCGSDHTLIIDYNGNAYIWGANDQGQLGISHSRRSPHIVSMTKIGKNIKHCASKGITSYIVNGDGQILKWPNPNMLEKFVPLAVPIKEYGIKFSYVTCGQDFAIGLTDNGLLYGYGENSYGQLGLSDEKPRQHFIKNHTLWGEFAERVSNVSCGYGHVIAKCFSGKVYTWGLNSHCQLGDHTKVNSSTPKVVQIVDYKKCAFKARSVQAGYESTFILTEDRTVYVSGSNPQILKNNEIFEK